MFNAHNWGIYELPFTSLPYTFICTLIALLLPYLTNLLCLPRVTVTHVWRPFVFMPEISIRGHSPDPSPLDA